MTQQQPQKAGFWRNIWDLLPFSITPKVSLDFQKTMSHEFGWNALSQLWQEMAVDGNGRVRVTNGSGFLNNIGPAFGITIQTTETLVVPINANRNGLYVESLGATYMRMAFNPGDLAAGKFLYFPNDMALFIDGFVGALFMDSPSLIQNVNVLEA